LRNIAEKRCSPFDVAAEETDPLVSQPNCPDARGFSLRVLTPEDAPTIISLEKELFAVPERPWTLEYWEDELKLRARSRFFIALEHQQHQPDSLPGNICEAILPASVCKQGSGGTTTVSVACYCGCWISGGVATLCTLGTAPQFQRQGLARRMIRLMHVRLRSKGITGVTLHARVSNTSAIGLYQSEGYVCNREESGYYDMVDKPSAPQDGLQDGTVGDNQDGLQDGTVGDNQAKLLSALPLQQEVVAA
jgi:ribosomal protein S18 acetylase RimI-like enzyme